MKKSISTLATLLVLFATAQNKKDSTKAKQIQEVNLSKKTFEKKADRFVYDVASSLNAKGNTAFGILKTTPMVSSTDDTNLKIAGKSSAIIYINGKKTQMNADSIAEFLKNIPAENIQKIEVITLPSSEYNVEGNEGIINIVLKKNTSDGLSGNLRMSNAQNVVNESKASLGLNYHHNKLGITSNISTKSLLSRQKVNFSNGNSSAASETQGTINSPNNILVSYVNIDYQISDKSSIALSTNILGTKSGDNKSHLFTKQTNLSTKENIYSITENHEKNNGGQVSNNLNYELKTDSLGSKLTANVAYLSYKKTQNNQSNTFLSNAQEEKISPRFSTVQSIPQVIHNFSVNVDNLQKFKKDWQVSFGALFSQTNTDNNTQFATTLYRANTEITEQNPNHFQYKENIYSGYLTVEKSFGEAVSAKIGTRYEATKTNANSISNQKTDFDNLQRSYQNLLPYLSVNYNINENNNVSYAFSSRIKRPSFWELNPVRYILTDTNYTQNNPFVKASPVYTHEINYMLKNTYFLNISHSLTKDAISQVPLQGLVNGKNQLRYIRTNFGNSTATEAMVGMQKSFFKKRLQSNLSVGVVHNAFDAQLSEDPITKDVFPTYYNNRKTTSLQINANTSLLLDQKKTWILGANYFYVDKQQIELGVLSPLMSLNVSVKKLWNNWTFSLEASDLLRTNVIKINDIQSNGNYNTIRQDNYNREIELSIVYKFGNKKTAKNRTIESANSSIQTRTN